MIQRWTFTQGVEVWRLSRNPRSMGPIHEPHRSEAAGTPGGEVLVLRTPVGGFPWDFAGRVHTKAEYDAFLDWATRAEVVVTDHLGRGHRVIPLAFDPTPAKLNGTRNPWLFDYTFKTLYLGRTP